MLAAEILSLAWRMALRSETGHAGSAAFLILSLLQGLLTLLLLAGAYAREVLQQRLSAAGKGGSGHFLIERWTLRCTVLHLRGPVQACPQLRRAEHEVDGWFIFC